MAKGKFVLRFSSLLVEQPVIYRLVKEYDLVVNILKADINPHKEGFVVLELSGDRENYHNGLEYIKSLGVGVDPLSNSIIRHQERCLRCGACATVCPTGALYLIQPNMEVHFDSSLCIACKSCVDVCGARAIDFHFLEYEIEAMSLIKHTDRIFRSHIRGKGLVSFRICVKETDLYISVNQASYTRMLPNIALNLVLRCQEELEKYIARNPEFRYTIQPFPVSSRQPRTVRIMASAAARAGVGPMAAVAGTIAELVGRGLLRHVREVIVENGSDIFMKTLQPCRVGVFAGTSPLSDRMGLLLQPEGRCLSVCTSSGTVGPALSFGLADAAVVVSEHAALADAAATALGNMVQDEHSITDALNLVRKIKGVRGALVILKDKLKAVGDIKMWGGGGDTLL